MRRKEKKYCICEIKIVLGRCIVRRDDRIGDFSDTGRKMLDVYTSIYPRMEVSSALCISHF